MMGERAEKGLDLSQYALPRPDFGLFPEREIVLGCMLRATGLAAVFAHRHIQAFTGGSPEIVDLSGEERKRRSIILDTGADRAFRLGLEKAPFQSYGVAAEGAKEAHPDKLGLAMPLAVGRFGIGVLRLAFVVDVVEGTTRAVHGRPEAVSVVGLSTYGGITPIPINPETGQEANYARKLFAPKEFRGVLSLEIPTRNNLMAIMRVARIRADAITVAVMDRKCNAGIISEASELGVKVELISSGDLLWGLRAMISDPEHPIIMLGRGGAPEGLITAIAARALGATGQLRIIEEEKDIEKEYTSRIWTPGMLIPGAPEHSMVIFSAITLNTHFDLPAVRPTGQPNQYEVANVVIDSEGVHIGKIELEFPESL